MDVTLDSEMQAMVQRQIDAGSFRSPTDVVAAALHAMEAEETALKQWRSEFNEVLDARLASLDRGESFSEEEVRSHFANRSREWRMRSHANAA